MTRDLMIVAASLLSKEQLIDKIEESVKEWKIYRNKEKLTELEFYCHLMVFKDLTEHHGGLEETLKIAKAVDKREEIFKIVTN